jgi:hypothetical protein
MSNTSESVRAAFDFRAPATTMAPGTLATNSHALQSVVQPANAALIGMLFGDGLGPAGGAIDAVGA